METAEVLKFQGRRDYPIAQTVDDWGLTPEQQETKNEEFRRHLAEKGAWNKERHDYYTLLRFLRARNYDLDKATKMWMDHMEWRKEFSVDTILEDFNFTEKEAFITAYPQGYHKTDRMGRPVYIQHLGKIDIVTIKQITSEDRMIKFHIQEWERCIKHILPVCSKLQGRNIDQTFGIMDVKGVGLGHLTGEVKRLVSAFTKYDQDNYPEMLGHICIINAPMMFKAIWGIVKPMLNARTQSKIEICSRDYVPELKVWIDDADLLEYLGGNSKGTLLDDIGPWSDPSTVAKLGLTMPSMSGESPIKSGLSRMGSEVDDGYATPRSEASFLSSTSNSQMFAPDSATNLARTSNSKPVKRGTKPEEADFSSEGLRQELTGQSASRRSRALQDRIRLLEQQLQQQEQRLKGYIPQTQVVPHVEANAPDGTLLYRLENLEMGMDVLLRAQELQWQESAKEGKKKARSCCCCVM